MLSPAACFPPPQARLTGEELRLRPSLNSAAALCLRAGSALGPVVTMRAQPPCLQHVHTCAQKATDCGTWRVPVSSMSQAQRPLPGGRNAVPLSSPGS